MFEKQTVQWKPWLWIAIFSLLLSAFTHSITAYFGIRSGDGDFSCASPFAILSKSAYPAILLQPFMIRHWNDFLLFLITLLPLCLVDWDGAGSFDSDFEFTAAVSASNSSFSTFFKFISYYVLFIMFRMVFGYVFFRGFGWSHPELFFQSSFHECVTGILPVLVINLFVSTFMFFVRRQLLSVSKMRHNYTEFTRRSSLWLMICVSAFLTSSSAGIWTFLSSFMAALLYISVCVWTQQLRATGKKTKRSNLFFLSSISWKLIINASVPLSFLFILFITVISFTWTLRQVLVAPADLRTSLSIWHPEFSTLISVFIVSAPRKEGSKRMLSETLNSFLDVYPRSIDDTLHGRLKLAVYTEFLDDEHPAIQSVYQELSDTALSEVQIYRRGKHIGNVDLDDSATVRSQRQHFAHALETALDTDSAYIMLVEDDFPLCPGGWNRFLQTLNAAYGPMPQRISDGPCGVFIGTGGSGILIRRDIVKTIISLLQSIKYINSPTDIVIQKCIRGQLVECSVCLKEKLVVSEIMLMHHIGYNSSTYTARSYPQDEWQCGWRQPFNIEPDVRAV